MTIKSNIAGGTDEPGGGQKPMFGQGPQFPAQTAAAAQASKAEDYSVNRSKEKAAEPYEAVERRERYQQQSQRWAPERPASATRDRFPADPGWQSRTPLVGHEDDFAKWEQGA